MNLKLHLLGGSGRIGCALVDSLVAEPLACLKRIYIYCDSTKVKIIQARYSCSTAVCVMVGGYSDFDSLSVSSNADREDLGENKHIILNLRGINNKQQWLNQPLDSLELHTRSCLALVDAGLWVHPSVEIFHFSSLLCDLIEGPSSLDDICEGQESYRRPYMISRLHQEMILAANAYKYSICTSFLRMPAIYGFEDDKQTPWVLNSLCRLKLSGQNVQPRHPERIIYLSHKDLLLRWLRSLIQDSACQEKQRTVNYFKPPMLSLSVLTLAKLVQESPNLFSAREAEHLGIILLEDAENSSSDYASHLRFLAISISELLADA